MSPTLRKTAPCWVLAVVVLLAYGNSFPGVFQFDDYKVIVNSTEIHSWKGWAESIVNGFRPLLKLTYLLNWVLGEGTFGFHLFNVMLHGGNTLLVYLLTLQFGRSCATERDWSRAALFTALLFAVHPVHSEAVTYLSGRSASLMTFFYLSALLAYARSLEAGQIRFRYLSLVLFVLAVLTKESAMLFPLALLVWEWACRTPWRMIVKRLWPFGMLFMSGAVALLLHPKYWTLMSESVQLRSLHDSFLTQVYVTLAQTGKLTWPFTLNIDPEYPVQHEIGAVFLQFILLVAMIAFAVVCRRTRPWLSLGLAWLVVHLMVLNTFFPRSDIANERQLYWADWAMFFAFAVEVEHWLSRRTVAVTLGVVVCFLAGLTLQRNTVYYSEVAMWEDTVAKSPNKARAWNNLGFAYQLEGRKDKAVYAYCTAIRINSGLVKAYNNLERIDGKCEQQTVN